ncbi:hypothetical protein BDR06DRAFT_1069579, partial [Suillus hirtellus]
KGVHLTCHKHILTSVVSLTALAAHYTTVLTTMTCCSQRSDNASFTMLKSSSAS